MLAVNANIVTFEAASPAYIQGIVDLLNYGVTPAIHWRGRSERPTSYLSRPR
jgi:histidine ammonia-lyase